MLIVISLSIIIFYILYRLNRKPKKNQNPDLIDTKPEQNINQLRKAFFSVTPIKVTDTGGLNADSVYGLLMETHSNGAKFIFGVYINGLTGYFGTMNGGKIAGYTYNSNAEIPLHSLCEAFQKPFPKRKLFATIRLLKVSNYFLTKAGLMTPHQYEYSSHLSNVQFWFLTKAGNYYKEVPMHSIDNSPFKKLYTEVVKFIQEQDMDFHSN